jgi:nitroreductase
MEAIQAIYERRATRRYTGETIDDPVVRELIEAAIQAPSAVNRQPWAFVIVQNEVLLRRISDIALDSIRDLPELHLVPGPFHEAIEKGEFDIFYGAGTLILLCAKEGYEHADWDVCFAAQNLMIAARARGLGSCPIGFAWPALERPEVREALGIPTGYRPIMPLVVGPVDAFPPGPGRKPPEVLAWHRQSPAPVA